MKPRGILVFAVLAVAVSSTAFYVGRTRAVEQSWLRNAPRETIEADRRFEEQVRHSVETVRAEQAVLSTMLADADSTGEQVLAQVGRATESYGALIRTVGRHLVQLRDDLPRSQAKALMQSCAGSVRNQVQRRYRWRGGAQDQVGGRGYMGGRGTTGRRGKGGPGYRGGQDRGRADAGNGLVRALGLTEEQRAWIQQQDPDFEADCTLLKDRLNEVHTQLAASLEDAGIDTEALSQRIDNLVEAHADLEKRVAQHLVLLRPHLSAEQRKQLSELCGGTGDRRYVDSPQGVPAGAWRLAGSFLPLFPLEDSL
ncbi:MAG: periplasmic heavy metal sensor [Phycisphaerales bacterium]